MNIYTPSLNEALSRLEKSIAEAKKVIPTYMEISICNTSHAKSTFNLRDLNKELINNKQ